MNCTSSGLLAGMIGPDDAFVKLDGIVPVPPISDKVDGPEPPNKKLKLLLCRNCGNFGHHFCKMIFTEEQRVAIDESVHIQLAARKLPKVPKPKVTKQVVCKNCASTAQAQRNTAQHGAGQCNPATPS